MKIYYFLTLVSFLLISCSNEKKQDDLLEIPIDAHQNDLLLLSEIAEEITEIELELTDESILSPDYINRIIISENEVFIENMTKIYVFSRKGKFIRTIGSRGQGPGEYTYITNMAMDEKNKRLFVISSPKIICYDFYGKFLKEVILFSGAIHDINYINGELLLLTNSNCYDSSEFDLCPTLYRLDDEFRIVDSCRIMSLYRPKSAARSSADFILKNDKSVFLYYGDFSFITNNNLREKILSDTLYLFKNNHIVPDLKLKFKNDGADKFIHLLNIYRSSRYIFALYFNYNFRQIRYHYCYDTKTKKGYNMQDGYTDDINGIEKLVQIRPINYDTEMFYYLHTKMKPDDLEEPNPTLYIGKLKK